LILKKFSILFSALLSIIMLTSGGDKHKTPADSTSTASIPYAYRSQGKDREIKVKSFYITMKDGIKIAASIYLPADLKEGEKLPTIFHQTRYWRSITLRWPLRAFKSTFVDGYSKIMKKLVLNRYAVVNIDVRGTGASFGYEKDPFSKQQIKDASEIIDWIVQQNWSDGQIGLLGASYTGMAAEFSLASKNPHIKALMSLYTGLDFYDEMIFPGGVYHQYFAKTYSEFSAMLDRNDFTIGSKTENFFIKGVTPVQHGKKLLKQALAERTHNFNIYDQTSTINFRNDAAPDNSVQSIDELSLHSYLKEINEANIPICLYTGWFDGNFALGSSRLFNNLKGTQNKLIIGPWDHGSMYNCSPYVQQKCTFDRMSEVMRFFDYHLKKKENGLNQEPAVRYFTMGEEQWKTSAVWPPANTTNQTFYFSTNHQLSNQQPVPEQAGYDTYITDTTAGTGSNTRSESLVLRLTSPKMYDSRTERDKKLICYNTLKLDTDVEVTGHPIITLYVDVDATDAGFFVYLEDIDEKGEVHYITEGIFRALHRNSTGDLGYKDIVPQYTYQKNFSKPLKSGEISKLEFDLLPVSHLFRKGHTIRLAISCSDNDHYKKIAPNGTTVKIHRSILYSSKINLPITIANTHN
jgi:putative CocE/NonD family hydrolase